jgi:hypothetical protein
LSKATKRVSAKMAELGYTEDIADKICDKLAAGTPIYKMCEVDPSLPTGKTIHKWIRLIPEFEVAISRARVENTHNMVEEVKEIADIKPPNDMNGKTDAGFVQHLKLRCDMRIKLAQMLNKKDYGDSVDVTSGGEKITGIAIRYIEPDPSLKAMYGSEA